MGGTISDCYVDVNTKNVRAAAVGGLAGGVAGNVEINNCTVSGSLSNSFFDSYNPDMEWAIGGLVGYAVEENGITPSLTINNSKALALVTPTGKLHSGHFVGMADTNAKISINNSVYDGNLNPILSFVGEEIQQYTTITDTKSIQNKLYSLQIGINANKSDSISLTTAFALNNLGTLRNVGINDLDYISKIDEILASVREKQIEYGAISNRLESVLEEISIKYDNLVASRSTLRDADIAEVSSEYIRYQILQQAATTLMVTANQTPSIALQLL